MRAGKAENQGVEILSFLFFFFFFFLFWSEFSFRFSQVNE